MYQKSLIPSEGSIMEAPIGVFFIDGKTAKVLAWPYLLVGQTRDVSQ